MYVSRYRRALSLVLALLIFAAPIFSIQTTAEAIPSAVTKILSVVAKLSVPAIKYGTKTVAKAIADSKAVYGSNVFDDVYQMLMSEKQRFAEVKEILSGIDDHLTAVSNAMQASVANLKVYIEKLNLSEQEKDIFEIINKYTTKLDEYRRYTEAAFAYCEAGIAYEADPSKEQGLINAKRALDTQETILSNALTGTDEYLEDIKTAAKLCCAYYPSYEADESSRGSSTGGMTYLDKLLNFCNDSYPFEHQTYEVMASGIQDAALPFALISQVVRVDLDYKASKNQEISDVDAVYFNRCFNAATNAINDVCGQYADYMDSLMRPYDAYGKVKMSYTGSREQKYEYYPVTPHVDQDLKLKTEFTPKVSYKAVKTKNEMYFNRVRTGAKTFLILSSEHDIQQQDITRNVELFEDGFLWNDQYYHLYIQTQDYFNLCKTKDGMFEMPYDDKPLWLMLESKSFNLANGSLYSYLAAQGGLGNVPNAPKLAIVTTNVPKPVKADAFQVGNNTQITENYYWLDTNSIDTLNDQRKIRELQTNGQDTVKNSSQVLVILAQTGELKYSFKPEATGSGIYELYMNNGGNWERVSGSVDVTPGQKFKIRVAEKDQKFKRVTLREEFGGELCELFDRELFECCKDENGCFEMELVSPYQRCWIRAEFEGALEPEPVATPTSLPVKATTAPVPAPSQGEDYSGMLLNMKMEKPRVSQLTKELKTLLADADVKAYQSNDALVIQNKNGTGEYSIAEGFDWSRFADAGISTLRMKVAPNAYVEFDIGSLKEKAALRLKCAEWEDGYSAETNDSIPFCLRFEICSVPNTPRLQQWAEEAAWADSVAELKVQRAGEKYIITTSALTGGRYRLRHDA